MPNISQTSAKHIKPGEIKPDDKEYKVSGNITQTK